MIIVQIAGRLGKDAETRFTTNGQKVTTLTLATNVRKGGKEETVWWRVTIWGERYDKMLPYLKKGSAIIVVGEMNKPEIWTDKEGRPQVNLEITAEIIRFSPFGNGQERQEGGASTHSNNNAYASSQGNYGNTQPSQSYGNVQPNQGQASHNGGFTDFGTMSGSAQYAHEADEPIPF